MISPKTYCQLALSVFRIATADYFQPHFAPFGRPFVSRKHYKEAVRQHGIDASCAGTYNEIACRKFVGNPTCSAGGYLEP